MKPPKCKACGVEEWRHVCGGASNAASNKSKAASNRTVQQEAVSAIESPAAPVSVAGAGAKQRWSREAYNAYQRDWMRTERAKKKVVSMS